MKFSAHCRFILASFLLTGLAATAAEFSKTLTPEKMQATGLTKLTPEELVNWRH